MRSAMAALVLGAAAVLVGVNTVTFAQDDDLPDRSTLLKSDDTPCDGDLILESDDDDDDDVRRVRRGQDRVFEIDNENVSWVCLGENETRSDTMECPSETTHLRITRDDDVATFECYTRRRR